MSSDSVIECCATCGRTWFTEPCTNGGGLDGLHTVERYNVYGVLLADIQQEGMLMKRYTPSAVRNFCEPRIRKLARTYSADDRVIAIDETIDRLQAYRRQLVEEGAASDAEDDDRDEGDELGDAGTESRLSEDG